MSFRAVFDTNVVVAGKLSSSASSPNREILARWASGEFKPLFSDDVVLEYIEKLLELGVPVQDTRALAQAVRILGEPVAIRDFHFPVYPADEDDIAFFLCAANGNASYLVTYDSDFDPVRAQCEFRLASPIQFLRELREALTP